MIAVDTSALMAILLSEPEGDACAAVLEAEPHVLISAGTMAERLLWPRGAIFGMKCKLSSRTLPSRLSV